MLDVSEKFKELYDDKHIFAYGFNNTAVNSGHLNKYGHKIIAESILDYVSENEERQK